MANEKKQRLRARLPRGLADRGPAEIAATRDMLEKIRMVYESYGFDPVETPAMEYTDALGKFLPDQDRPNEGVFSFQDDDDQWISLRYDLTAPLARYVAENYDALPKPYRSYRAGYVYRNEKPGPGRFRQFMQFDADTVGSASPAADAEICMMAADTMEALGIERGQYVVKINHRKVLDGVLEWLRLGLDDTEFANPLLASRRLTVMRALDKYDRLGEEGVRSLLGLGRIDKSGDRTLGAHLEPDQIDRLLWLLTLRSDNNAITHGSLSDFNPILKLYGDQASTFELMERDMLSAMEGSVYGQIESFREGLRDFRQMEEIFNACGYTDGRIRIDPSVVRGLEYYTGPVFEIELLLDAKDEKGRTVAFGSVGGGGRYDGLIGRFRPEKIPATGFSIGVSRLMAALATLGKVDTRTTIGPIVVTVFDKAQIADYQRIVQTLRKAPLNKDDPDGPRISAELYLGSQRAVGQQLKYASQRNAPYAIIQGSDEKNHPSGQRHVLIKDLLIGSEISDASLERDEYLEKQTEAQFAVPEVDLVETMQNLLAKRGASWI